MTDAWAETARTNQPIEVQKPAGEPRSRSGPGMCEGSPDTCHWWDLGAVGPQSAERFDCRWCTKRIWD